MAVQKIVKYGEEPLRKTSKEIHKISSKIQTLVKDLYDTMYAYNGVGLAAPQIGANYRVFVIDTATKDEPPNPITFINPKIVKKEGAMNSYEGCLSFPDVYINVRRYSKVIIRAKDIKGKPFSYEADAEKDPLIVKAFQHETDHLDGVVFIDHTRDRFGTDQLLAEKELPPIDPEHLLEEKELEEQIQEWEKHNPPPEEPGPTD